MKIPKDIDIKSIEKIRILDGAQLKWIAMLSMLIDHLDKGILLNLMVVKEYSPRWIEITSDIFGILGRISFPIFLFLLVEGFTHTKSKIKYFANLFLFGILAEVPYDMFESGEFFDWGGQNMYFTLALALLVIWCIDEIIKRIEKWYKIPIVLIIVLLGSYISMYLGLDYTYYGILIPVIFYLLQTRRIAASILSYGIIIKEIWSFTGFILVNMYNGKRGKINKWFCYLFYPLHLLIIGLIRIYIIKA